MDKFLTEKETEHLLEFEVRNLAMPSGEVIPVRGFKMMWQSFDLLQQAGMFTQEKLIELAYSWSEREKLPFETTLSHICGYAHRQGKKL